LSSTVAFFLCGSLPFVSSFLVSFSNRQVVDSGRMAVEMG
jgi:hypothetical protein